MAEKQDVVFKRVVIGGAFVESLAGELTKFNCDRVLREKPKAIEAELKKCKVEEKDVRKQVLYLFMVWAEVISKDAAFSRAQHKLIDRIEDVLEKAIVKEKKPFAILTKEEFDFFSAKWNAFNLWGGGKEIRIYTRALGSVIDAAEDISTVEAKALFEKKGELKEKVKVGKDK